jgi:hypothetical protein
VEIREVARKFRISEPLGLTSETPDAEKWWQQFPQQPVEAFALWLRAGRIESLSDAPKRLVDRVGLRRAATLALQEGELLALRLPERGIPLLALSAEAFSRCGDKLQSAIAATCKALALARCGWIEELEKQLGSGKKIFGADYWREAERFAEQDDYAPETPTAEWTRRLAACLALTRDRADRQQRCERVLRTWNKAVPAEVAGWLEAAAAGSGEAGIAPERASRDYGVLRLVSSRSRSSGSTFEQAEIEITYREERSSFKWTIETPSHVLTYPQLADWLRIALNSRYVEQHRWMQEQARLLLVDRVSAWLPWEAMLTDMRDIHRTYRRSTGRNAPDRRTVRTVLRRDLSIHTLTTNRAGVDIGGSVFGVLAAPWSYTFRPNERWKTKFGEQQILHIFADPLEATAGVRLRLGEQYDQDRGDLIRPDEVLSLLPNPVLCILQLGDARGERTGADREKAALLRSFAAELHDRGMPMVITVPSVGFGPSVDVLKEVSWAIRARGDADDLLRSTVDARLALIREASSYPDALECAFDICFYGS